MQFLLWNIIGFETRLLDYSAKCYSRFDLCPFLHYKTMFSCVRIMYKGMEEKGNWLKTNTTCQFCSCFCSTQLDHPYYLPLITTLFLSILTMSRDIIVAYFVQGKLWIALIFLAWMFEWNSWVLIYSWMDDWSLPLHCIQQSPMNLSVLFSKL